MKGKITLLAGIGVGYVLGARAGRESYESIKQTATRTADKVRNDPRVQDAAAQASEVAKDKASSASQAVQDKVGSGDSGTSSSTGGTGTPTGTTGTTGTTGAAPSGTIATGNGTATGTSGA